MVGPVGFSSRWTTPRISLPTPHIPVGTPHIVRPTPHTRKPYAVAASKRASAVKVRGTIKALCRQRFLTLDQLARLLARNGPGLRERAI